MGKRKTKLDRLIAEVNDWCSSVEESLSSECSAVAEYCRDFGYFEGDIDLEQLDEYTKPHVETLLRRVSDKRQQREILSSCSELMLVGPCYEDNEVFRAGLGECEAELPDDLSGKIRALSVTEFETLRRSVDCFIPEKRRSPNILGYLNRDSDYWILVVNVDELYRRLQDISEPAIRRLETHAERREAFKVITGGAA